MIRQTQLALSDPAEWLGDFHPLAEQLGSADGLHELGSVSACLCLSPVRDLPSLRRFLNLYHEKILIQRELPAIQRAHAHAQRNELRELIAFDQQLVDDTLPPEFASASARVGRAQLQKLRPLRDDRFVKRYLEAADAGRARAWHTLVYGVTLAVYSLPVRQGLLGYAQQITRGFIYAAARKLQFSERECRTVFDEVCADMPAWIEALLRRA